MSFAIGSLVKARGREWVVLPESDEQMLILRPLGGSEDEVTGIFLPLEHVEPARFALPDPAQVGDYRSCRLLRDAVRLGFRSSAGPFRSFGHIAVEPRPYQLVPLLVALKLDPVRLLIAGKCRDWRSSARHNSRNNGRPSCKISFILMQNWCSPVPRQNSSATAAWASRSLNAIRM